MAGTLDKAFGYRGDNMNLPVGDVTAAVPFYTTVLGFTEVSRSAAPRSAAILARDSIRIRLVESGGDPTQDGCAFHVSRLDDLFAEFQANGLGKPGTVIDQDSHDGTTFRVFYVVAPDGLCYWFGEPQVTESG